MIKYSINDEYRRLQLSQFQPTCPVTIEIKHRKDGVSHNIASMIIHHDDLDELIKALEQMRDAR